MQTLSLAAQEQHRYHIQVVHHGLHMFSYKTLMWKQLSV